MKKRILGINGPSIPAIGLGCMGMSEFYGTAIDAESIKAIHRAVDLGISFLDTSDMYGPFTNEELVGKAIKEIRHKVTLATKFGIVRTGNPNIRNINGRPEYVKTSCEGSLKRLGTDYIDLYYQHRVDPNVPIEETIGAMSELVNEGKVKYLGLSEAGPKTIRRANQVHQITALQTEYSLWSRDPEDELLALTKELGIAFVAYSPLGRGFLTGRFKNFEDLEENDYRRFSPRFQGENFIKNLNLVNKLREIAETKNVLPGQLALAWVLARAENIIPIPGSTKEKHIEENISAAEIVLTNDEIEAIESVFPKGAASGLRYPEAMLKSASE